MFESLDLLELEELQKRWHLCRKLLQERDPRAEGLLLLAPHSIYWCSGHLANGALWLPLEGEPLLLVRKGLERARLESPLQNIHHFRSFKDLPRVMAEAGYAVPTRAAAELSGMSWAMGRNLESRLQEWILSDADPVLARARAVKTPRELKIMRLAGERHRRCMEEELPGRIAPGMSEREIGGAIWQEFFRLGHQGITRMSAPGSELVVGQVSAGDSGIYPTTLNGPVGLRGQHPSAPLIGYSGKLWQQGEILTLDTVFFLEGYHTDKTLVYFAGQESDADPGTCSIPLPGCCGPGSLRPRSTATVLNRPGKTDMKKVLWAWGRTRCPSWGTASGSFWTTIPLWRKNSASRCRRTWSWPWSPRWGFPGRAWPEWRIPSGLPRTAGSR